MPPYTRRRIIRDLGVTSAAGAASVVLPGWKKGTTTAASGDLYLIFPGSWLFSFENGGISAFTTHFTDHIYDFGISPPKDQKRAPIEKGHSYGVAVAGNPMASTPQALVADMIKASQGFIFKNVNRNQAVTSDLRTIVLPLPSAIHPAALIKGVTIDIAPNISQIPSIGQWPAALALIYSGGWTSVSITDKNTNQVVMTVSADQHNHVSFRTCQTTKCDKVLGCAIDCTEIKADVQHAHLVFNSIMTLLRFPDGVSTPTITFPPCIPNVGSAGGTFAVTVDPGADSSIGVSEIGMQRQCGRFGNLHNCAAGAGIIGA